MRIVTCLVGGLLVAAPSAAGAEPTAQSHQHESAAKHQATGQGKMNATAEKCCCEEMMKKVISEMMRKHQGMGMQMQKDAPKEQPDRAH